VPILPYLNTRIFKIFFRLSNMQSRDSAIGKATSYEIDGRSSRSLSPGRGKIFSFSVSSRLVLRGTQPRGGEEAVALS
jgi:hypothetical protein